MRRSLQECLWGVMLGLAILAGVAEMAEATDESWDRKIVNASKRFKVLTHFNNEAVRDGETRLVWEQAPDGTNTYTWVAAQFRCNNLSTGGRKGWQLPTIQEFASLVDPMVASPGPTLPSGHPFANVQPATYWSATSASPDAVASGESAWVVHFNVGTVDVLPVPGKPTPLLAWCVRGGQGVDPQ